MNIALIFPYNNPLQQKVLSETSASSCGDVSTGSTLFLPIHFC